VYQLHIIRRGTILTL